jgi:hypothetical protein
MNEILETEHLIDTEFLVEKIISTHENGYHEKNTEKVDIKMTNSFYHENGKEIVCIVE